MTRLLTLFIVLTTFARAEATMSPRCRTMINSVLDREHLGAFDQPESPGKKRDAAIVRNEFVNSYYSKIAKIRGTKRKGSPSATDRLGIQTITRDFDFSEMGLLDFDSPNGPRVAQMREWGAGLMLAMEDGVAVNRAISFGPQKQVRVLLHGDNVRSIEVAKNGRQYVFRFTGECSLEKNYVAIDRTTGKPGPVPSNPCSGVSPDGGLICDVFTNSPHPGSGRPARNVQPDNRHR